MRNNLIVLSVLMIMFFSMSCAIDDDIVIGFSASLSGVNSEVGVALRDGVKMYVNEINTKGGINGRTVKLVVIDDKNDIEGIAELDQSLIDQGVIAIIGHDMSSKIEESLPVITENNIIMISPTISTHTVSGIDDLFFRTMSTNYDQGLLIGDDAENVERLEHMLVLYDKKNKLFAEGIIAGFDDVFTGRYEVAEVIDLYQDYELYQALIRTKPFDSVLMIHNSQDVAFLAQKLETIKPTLQFYATNWGMTNDLLNNGGTAVEGMKLTAVVDVNTKKRSFLEFEERFKELYKKQPSFASVYGYDATKMLLEAIRMSKSINTEEIKKNLLKIENMEGVYGSFSFDEYGDIIREQFLFEIKEGIYIKITD